MKDRVSLIKNVVVGDAEAPAFKPDYIYLHAGGITIYFEPAFIPSIRLEYPGVGTEDGAGVIVMPMGIANNLKSALTSVMSLCRSRMEVPFEPPLPPEPEAALR